MPIQNKRILSILKILNKHKKAISGENLANLIGVSRSTIRRDIKDLNSSIQKYGAHILSEAGNGYKLVIDEQEKYSVLTEKYKLNSYINYTGDNIVPFDYNDRISFIIARILLNSLHNKIVNQEELAEELFISLSTLKKYLIDIKKSLARFNLELISDRFNGIKINGNETNIRYCISEYIFNRDDLINFTNNKFVKDIFSQEEINSVKHILMKVILKHNIRLTDIAFKNLLVHIIIIMCRSNRENTVEYTLNERKKLEQSSYFSSAKEILSIIQQQLGVDISNESYYLTQHFIASQKFIESTKTRNNCQQLISNILKKIKLNTNIDLSDDNELISGLTIHLIAAINRLKFNMNIRNGILESIKNNYPLAFEMAIIASEVIEQEENVKTNENEIGFLAIHFGASLERNKLNEEMGKTAIIVCATGLSTALLLKSKLQRRFGGILKITRVMSFYELTEQIINSVDFIFSTVPIPKLDNKKFILVEPIMTEDDLLSVEKQLNKNEENNFTNYRLFFKEDLFFPSLEATSSYNAIEQLADAMIQHGYIDNQVKQSIFERENMASTEIGGMIAIPHALENHMSEVTISVGILKNPIIWNKEKVQVIFLLSIPKHLYKLWENIFKSIYKAFIDKYGSYKLVTDPKFETLMQLLNNID